MPPTLIDSDFGPVDLDEMKAGAKPMTALFDPALRATHANGDPVIILGIDGQNVLIVHPSGKLHWTPLGGVTMDWRYDPETEQWVDIKGGPLEQANDT